MGFLGETGWAGVFVTVAAPACALYKLLCELCSLMAEQIVESA